MCYVIIIVMVFIVILNVIVGKEKCKWGMKYNVFFLNLNWFLYI